MATKLVCGVWHLFTGGNRSPTEGDFSKGERREPNGAPTEWVDEGMGGAGMGMRKRHLLLQKGL